ncbi:MAG TPA: hypothetical protein VFK66_04475 [Oryzihumus sp.]|nr:hypothetical protein [Oryzihumus sp.]
MAPRRGGATGTTSSTGPKGGPTDVGNAALLCGRHHTIVHQRGWTATVTATGVTWHT